MVDELLYFLHTNILPAAMAVLPARMDTLEARAMLLAIALQESGLSARIQQPRGPAHGLWQFERDGGVREVLLQPYTGKILSPICEMLLYDPMPQVVYDAIVNNDVLACVVARLRLWIDPRAMPPPTRSDIGWKIYTECWKPGTPRPSTWANAYVTAWQVVRT